MEIYFQEARPPEAVRARWKQLREQGVADIPAEWLGNVVELVRHTRDHADLRVGSSVRGAIDAAVVARSLSGVRGVPATDPAVGLDAALVALSGRVRVREGCSRTSEEIVTELWQQVFAEPDPDRDGADPGKATAPAGATSNS